MANKQVYSVSRAIPKEDVLYMNEDVYLPIMESGMKRDLGDTLVTMLESGEKIVRLTKVVREDDFPYNQYLYTQRLVCEDLVRCGNCRRADVEGKKVFCGVWGADMPEDFFCADGKRREDDGRDGIA